MGEHGWFDKRFMYEESFHTPLIISYPSLEEEKLIIRENLRGEKKNILPVTTAEEILNCLLYTSRCV